MAFTYNSGGTNIGVNVYTNTDEVARNVRVTGKLPNVGTFWTVDYYDGACQVRGLQVECFWPEIWYGSGATFRTARTCEALSARFSMSADGDTDRSNNKASITSPDLCKTGADMGVSIWQWASEDEEGFHIEATNAGPASGNNVTFFASFIENGWTLRDSTFPSTCEITEEPGYPEYGYPGATHLSCGDMGTLPAGTTYSADMVAPERDCKVTVLTGYVNIWASNEFDDGDNWNYDEIYLPQCPGGADLQLFTGSYRRSPTDIGYELTVYNAGPDVANGTTFGFSIPSLESGEWEFTYDFDAASCAPDEGGLTCDLGDLPPGETRHVSVTTTEATCSFYEIYASADANNDWQTGNNYTGSWIEGC